MRCPVCGTQNPASAKFCNECGTRLQSITCPNCQALNRPDAKFCNECGLPLPTSLDAAQPLLAPQRQQEKEQNAAPEEVGAGLAPAVFPPATSATAPLSPPASLVTGTDSIWVRSDSEERRVVTVLFADMTGSTALADRMDPEEVRQLMAGYFEAMAQVIHRHGGTIEKYIGDAVMAIFGLPVAHEDDPERAVRAALEMLEALQRFNEQRLADDPEAPPVQIRIGISTGEVVAGGNAGDGGQFLVTGDTVNVAARFQQQAEPGTILVGSRTYRSTHGAIVYQPLSPIQVKGKPQPLRVWQAVDAVEDQAAPPTQHLRGIEGLPSPFIGRVPELSLLDALYERVIGEQRPHLITLLGVPGVGKSRLVREWMQRLGQHYPSDNGFAPTSEPTFQEPLWLEGRCPPYGAGLTYWPLAEILRSYVGIADSDTVEQASERLLQKMQEIIDDSQESEHVAWIARQLGFSIGLKVGQGEEVRPSADSSEQRENLFRAWRIFFESLARRQPLLVLIDDIHWANEVLLDLLEYLTQRVSNAPLLFLCPARLDLLEKRPGWGGGKRNLTTLTLEPLSAEQSHELIDALLSSGGLPPTLRNSILAKAEGNPFFVEEMIRMLIDLGMLVCRNDHWQAANQDPSKTYSDLLSVSIPDSIQGVLAARIDLLAPTEKRVLQHAAVAGRTFWKGALADLSQEISLEGFELALKSLVRKDFFVENERPSGILIEKDVQYSFNHVLVRDVAYGSVPRTRRAREHARMAEWLERVAAGRVEGFVELLAYHYQQSVVAWSQTASGEALARRPARAQAQADLRQKAISYLMLAGNEALGKYAANQAVRHYTDALALFNSNDSDLLLRQRLHEQLASAYFVLSDGDACWEHYQQALDVAKDAPALERAHFYQHLTMLGTRWRPWFKQPPELSLLRAYLDEGFALLRDQPEVIELALLLASEAFWYMQAYFSQQLDESAIDHAIASAERAASIAERLNDPVYLSEVLDALSSVYGNISDNRAFLEVQKRRLALIDRIKDRVEIFDIYYTASRAYHQLSDYPQALYWADAALKVAESMNSRRKLCGMLGNKVQIYFQWDKWAEVLLWGEKLATLCEQYDLLSQSWPAPYGIAALAIVYYRTGQDERGDYYAQMAERAAPEGSLHHEFLSGQVRVAQRRLEEARDIFQRLSVHYTAIERPQIQWRLVELAALLGDDARYDELAPAAFALMERSGNRKGLASLVRIRGMVNSKRGAVQQATEDFQTALDWFRQIGTRWEEALTLEALAVHLTQAQVVEQGLEPAGLLHDALKMYEDLHAGQDVLRVRMGLERTGSKAIQDVNPRL